MLLYQKDLPSIHVWTNLNSSYTLYRSRRGTIWSDQLSIFWRISPHLEPFLILCCIDGIFLGSDLAGGYSLFRLDLSGLGISRPGNVDISSSEVGPEKTIGSAELSWGLLCRKWPISGTPSGNWHLCSPFKAAGWGRRAASPFLPPVSA